VTGPRFEVRLSARGSQAARLQSIAALLRQVYGRWTLTLAGAARNLTATDRLCRSCLGRPLPTGDASDCDWVIPLIPGDALTPDALSELALAAQACGPDTGLIYGDHMERFGVGASAQPFYKPAWSPEFQLMTGYVARAAFRRELLAELPPLAPAFSALELRGAISAVAVSRRWTADRVQQCLFDLSSHEGGTSDSVAAARGCRTVKRLLDDAGLPGTPYWPDWAREIGEAVFDLAFPDTGPSVAILIPSRNNWRQLQTCLDSLRATTYRDYSVTVIDNASDDPETRAYLRGLACQVLEVPNRPDQGFSFSYVNNTAAAAVDAEHLLFLNDDVEVIEPTWLSRMVGWLNFPGVASVGAGLWYPNGLLQHTGLVHRLLDRQLPAPAFKLLRASRFGPRAQARCVRNYAGVTAACMLTPRRLFLDSGGFDDTDFQIAYNDCDYGFRLTAAGWRHVGCPSAALLHHEGATRGRGPSMDKVSEEVAFIEKYRDWPDPFYNANLSLETTLFQPAPRAAGGAALPLRRPSVVLCSHNLNFEGAPLVLAEVADGLIRQLGAAVTVASPHEGPLRARLEAMGCRVAIVSTAGIFDAADETALAAAAARVAQEIERFAPDAVVANTLLGYFGLLASARLQVPYLWIVHESEPDFAHLASHGELHAGTGHRLMRQAYCNVFVSKHTKAVYARHLEQGNATVIYNPADTQVPTGERARAARTRVRAELGIADDALVFLMPGVVCERKAQIDLLDAMAELRSERLRQCHLVILGDRPGRYSERLHTAAEALPAAVRRRVHILPEVPDAGPHFAAADALAFTSRMESLPLAVMEAMAAGLAIVTTPVFGIKEQVRDGESALFFEPGDTAALSRAMDRVAADPELRARLGRNARLALRRFPGRADLQRAYATLVREAILSGAPTDPARTGA
jgi:glycosyltransferase involved in cell wall biosynthesis/GT2 family glycosyltransferase